ncbi:MFS transporter [Mycobacterium ostraviense]|nr:MFS transporter [Mycobacterium ostraviense]UGT90531.1 MFS transporter [Mycobacterium ostraviense]
MTRPIFRNHRIPALAVICLGVFLISVDATIVNVALPRLSRDLSVDTAQLQWFVDAYTLVMSGLLLSAGNLSDRYGRRGWLNAGLVLFAITSGVAAQANSADALIAAAGRHGCRRRGDLPDHAGADHQHLHRPRPLGQGDRSVGGHGECRGGRRADQRRGWLLEHFWWGSIFMVNIPIAIIAIAGGILFVPTSRDPAAPRVDVPGLLLSAVGITVLVYTVIEAPTWGWASTRSATGSVWPQWFSLALRCGNGAAATRCWTCRYLPTVDSPAAAWR